MSIQVIENFLTLNEVNELKNYYSDKDYTKEKYKEINSQKTLMYRNKNTNYDDENSLVYKILGQKIKDTFKFEKLNSGAFLESHYPFELHVDSVEQFEKNNFNLLANLEKKSGVIIPLDESEHFKTVYFDKFFGVFELPEKNSYTPKYNHPYDLSHLSDESLNFVNSLEITDVYNWKLGSVVCFPRNQLHCATNFARHGLIKTAIVLFF